MKTEIKKLKTEKWRIFGDVEITVDATTTGTENWADYTFKISRGEMQFEIVTTERVDCGTMFFNELQEYVIVGSMTFSDFCDDYAADETDLARYQYWRNCALVTREYENMFTAEEQNLIEEYENQIEIETVG